MAMITQRDALLRLLRDDDAETVSLVKSELAQKGTETLEELRILLAAADAVAAAHLRDVLRAIEMREADTIFMQLCGRFEEDGDLEDAVWRLAATFLPREDFLIPRQLLDQWGAEVLRRLSKAATSHDRIETLVEFLGDELRFRGNAEDYYNINNSLLPEVIETRVGIPITLSLIYMFVGRRAGLKVEGVGLPGHFIIRHGEDFFDPFNSGRRLGLDDCRALAAECGSPLRASDLQPATAKQILIRVLGNIFTVAKPSDPPLASKVSDWIEALHR